jgi:tripartite-type tricarboxylate transporter receptor subunit TctC
MSTMTRRQVCAMLAALAAAPFARAQAQARWPSGVTRIVVPFPPGGSVDPIARLLQPVLQERLGTNVIVENKTGASGSIGTAAVAGAEPDGRTWLFTFDNHVLNPFVLSKLPFDTEKDLEAVHLLGKAPYVMCTGAQKPYRTLADVVAASRDKPLTYGTPGAGSMGHLATVLLAKQAGAQLSHVPYKGGGPAMQDAIGGHIELFVGSMAVTMPQIQAGTIRPLVQLGRQRTPALAHVPTAIESGLSNFVAEAWWGFFAPAKTPAELVRRFSAEVKAATQTDAVGKRLRESLQVTLVNEGPDETRQFVRDQMRLWGPVALENHIKTE